MKVSAATIKRMLDTAEVRESDRENACTMLELAFKSVEQHLAAEQDRTRADSRSDFEIIAMHASPLAKALTRLSPADRFALISRFPGQPNPHSAGTPRIEDLIPAIEGLAIAAHQLSSVAPRGRAASQTRQLAVQFCAEFFQAHAAPTLPISSDTNGAFNEFVAAFFEQTFGSPAGSLDAIKKYLRKSRTP